MAFYCIRNSMNECDGCMCCKPTVHYYCPVCGKEVYETVFVDKSGDVVGCEHCLLAKEPYEVFDDEANE